MEQQSEGKNSSDNNIESMLHNWNDKLIYPSKIAEIEPEGAYAAFIGSFKNKFTYSLRIIPDINDYLQPIEDTIAKTFIPVNSYHYQQDVWV